MWKRKPVKLEKKAHEDELHGGFLLKFWSDWGVHRRYDTPAQAIQAHEQLVKSSFYRRFEWRIISDLGTIHLPVVKS